jgi:thioredoxin-related protein
MRKLPMRTKRFWLAALVLVALGAHAKAPIAGIGEFEIPLWFKVSFLDLKRDIAEAAAHGKRLAVFFHQDGCPYCAALINHNFSQKHIVDYTRNHFDFVEINMWGDREVTDLSGRPTTEKSFAVAQKVWFTPTLLFFDEQGKVILRVNGYYPPHQFLAALQYAGGKQEKAMSFAEYYEKLAPPSAAGALHSKPFFQTPPYDFAKPAARPLLVLFEQKDCSGCDELHGTTLAQAATLEQIKRYDVYQLDRWSNTPVVTPGGKQTSARQWADELGVAYVPSAVIFVDGREVMRIEAMFKSFHVQSILDYVASGAYKQQLSFQRFIQARADRLREQGVAVDLWK